MTSHGLEEWDDILPLEGKDWVAISNHDKYMEKHYTFPCWLKPECLLYYLPSVICFTYRHAEENISIPEVCSHMISMITDKEVGIDFSKLTISQHEAVQDWFLHVKGIKQKEVNLCGT